MRVTGYELLVVAKRRSRFIGDALTVLKGYPNNTFRCCVTSPPYWGLRDYGVHNQIGSTERTIHIINDSKRTVMIEFFSDPDVRITQKLESGVRPLVSMEIKGGTDASNIHNRVGEAEKSHQKAKNLNFFEFWTIIRVDVDSEVVKRESPTTTHFFHIDRIIDSSSPEHAQFKDLLAAMMGIRI